MTFEYIVYTPMMEDEDFLREMNSVLLTLKKHNIGTVEMFYGWSWGDWKSFTTALKDVQANIKKQEKETHDNFPGNDVYLDITEHELQITFCHERDIHIEFNRATPIVLDIIADWRSKKKVHYVRKDKMEIALEDIFLST